MLKPRKGLWLSPWSRSALRPEIARLVARPNLILSFANFGGSPFDDARRLKATVNGAPNWVSSPYGPAMHFPTASVGTPADFLTFTSGKYPTTNGTTIPHSVAVLWSADNIAAEFFPFSTDAAGSGNGVFLRGGSSGFKVTHGGVIDFTYIGSALVAGHWYLQCYSFDRVTMNHLVIDLNTGAVASQSVANTSAITTGSGPSVPFNSPFETLEGKIAGLAWVRGAWTINEMTVLAANPTAIWSPAPRRRSGQALSGTVPVDDSPGSPGIPRRMRVDDIVSVFI